jgi:hypothetical protein
MQQSIATEVDGAMAGAAAILRDLGCHAGADCLTRFLKDGRIEITTTEWNEPGATELSGTPATLLQRNGNAGALRR